jgi:hypothetical protein
MAVLSPRQAAEGVGSAKTAHFLDWQGTGGGTGGIHHRHANAPSMLPDFPPGFWCSDGVILAPPFATRDGQGPKGGVVRRRGWPSATEVLR